MTYLFIVVVAWICVIGLYGVATSRNLIHLALCLAVTQSSTYVLLFGIIYKTCSGEEIFYRFRLYT